MECKYLLLLLGSRVSLRQLSSGYVSRKNKVVVSAEAGKGKRNQNFEVYLKGRSETGSFPIRSEL